MTWFNNDYDERDLLNYMKQWGNPGKSKES